MYVSRMFQLEMGPFLELKTITILNISMQCNIAQSSAMFTAFNKSCYLDEKHYIYQTFY